MLISMVLIALSFFNKWDFVADRCSFDIFTFVMA